MALFSFVILCRIEINARVYVRDWLAPPKAQIIEPLSSSCFRNTSSSYPSRPSKYHHNFVPGLPTWEEYTCYDFASMLYPSRNQSINKTTFHTYWSKNLTSSTAFGEKEFAVVRSFVATQDAAETDLIIWISPEDEPDLKASPAWQHLSQVMERLRYEKLDMDSLTSDTPLKSYSASLSQLRPEETVNLIRLLVLYNRGGVWFDFNTMFTRDLSPLLEHEWIAQGSCFTTMFGNPFDGGLLHFRPQSPYVCELMAGASDVFEARRRKQRGLSYNDRLLDKRTKDPLGAGLYYRIYRRLLHHRITPWSVLPWCFTDPSQCKQVNSLPSLAAKTSFRHQRITQTFAYHWHEGWSFKPGDLFKYLESLHKEAVGW
ncbi:uncharacterized protein BYT42DRAFT_546907 [Radiomyces spectabilis]|uniref:uncharacterized protein n=1 Tax=Radiomyces spectabilis TaxID=64574 RepID=UPI00221F329A|nr:uncharacterized protein BYT42DRAFT_546907 [Radiomyces spectabilis]KAI8376200.1 hypothetical protein BYT42DRAFT_546907 [Radiomyces spectabilis]